MKIINGLSKYESFANPDRAGLVGNEEEYIYSSAKNYANHIGLVLVETLTRLWKRYSFFISLEDLI